MGLLENLTSEQGINGLLGNPLLNIGLGILANNTGHYGQFSPAVGLGGQQGLQAVQLQQQALARRKLLEMEAQKQQMELDAQKRQQQFLESWGNPNATRDVTQTTPNTYVNASQGTDAPNFQMDKVPGQTTTTQESYFDPNKGVQSAVHAGVLPFSELYKVTQDAQNKKDLAIQNAQDKMELIKYQLEQNAITKRDAFEQTAALQRELKQMGLDMQGAIANQASADRRFAVDNRPQSQEPAPTMTEVIDPKNPNQLLRVNARTYQGGSIGESGVLGVSGKEPTAAHKEEQANQGKQALSDSITTLRDYYNQLDKAGGISSTKNRIGSNVAAGIESSGIGQATGRLFGTQNQSIRNSINTQRPLLLQAIKQATGMSAKQMDSNVELKLWLSAATDPALDITTNLNALDSIERKYLNNDTPPQRRESDKIPNVNADLVSAAQAELAKRRKK